MTDEQLGRLAFEAYSESTGWVTHDGREIPTWDDLTDAVRTAWVAAAIGVKAAIAVGN